ncbi:DUF4123 domain-containing protein [Burkholderia cepacia]|uniref:DUF4123 domain-containing protein n=1 Tax=Burkholderia cepacia TaxID=292 RepID=UPI000CF12BF4|nr:DUF4123 domain-containing protein [Burkholderia cepacia]KAB1585305.1 DUF4123 domain-containing protein [Burkholderia cepacia]
MSLHQHLSDLRTRSCRDLVGMYFLVESGAHPDLLARMEFHDIVHRSLWRIDLQSDLERHAPFLFVAPPESAFDAWLGATVDTLPMTVISSRHSIDTLIRHLRRFSKFEDLNGRYFLRLGDPASLQLYVASLAQHSEQVARFFDQGAVGELYFHDPRSGLSRCVSSLFEQNLEHAENDGYLVWRDGPVAEDV